MAARLENLLPRLDERSRRLALGAEARSWGYGGITAVHRATGASKITIRRGIGELEAEDGSGPGGGRVRAPGGGRKKAEVSDPGLVESLLSLIEPGTRGDPESPLRWTVKSTRKIAAELTAMGHQISHNATADLLHSLGFSLQGNRKTLEGAQHPDRDAQFRYINSLAESFLAEGSPVVSVDTKKKELVGRFGQSAGNGGQPDGRLRYRPMTFLVQLMARPFLTVFTILQTTVPGYPSASITTRPCSRWPPSRRGGAKWAGKNTRMPVVSSLRPTAAARMGIARGCGSTSLPG